MNMEEFVKEITIDEGVKHEIYLDHLGLPTVGVGHLITEWDEYKILTPEDFVNNMRNPVLVDGRRIYNPNIFDKKLKFRAIGLGPIN